ncbi:MAG: extracellular solute-binding protein [Candidatus Buchananbacteria bacterium]|nr:extracellular solute-binding protein [Candidatus Buchananbacteria bacterium]
MKRKYFNSLNLFLIFAFLLTAGFGCKNPGADVQEKMKPIELNYWRVFDDQDSFNDIIAKYKLLHPNIKINYRKFRIEEYEQAILEALAEDRGPDILSINESDLRKYQTKLASMPAEIVMAYQYTKGTVKKEVAYELRTKKSPSLREIKANFADTVYDDVVLDGQVYGLPMSLETLIMFYNKDILNKSGIAQVPKDWKAFQEAVQKSTRFDTTGRIIQSGSALGTGYNIERSFDIISVLIMQNGAVMIDGNGFASFNQATADKYFPGLEAIRFYLDFSSPVKSVYSWNADMPNSFESFLSGKVAFMFGYNYHLPSIKSRAPKLNLGLAPIPQVSQDNQTNYANYWVESVSKKSAHQSEAWDFIIFASSKDNVTSYLNTTGRPTALKELLNTQMDNENLYPTSLQTLTAKNWYKGKNQPAAEEALKEMIEALPTAVEDRDFSDIIKNAISKINQTIR